MVAHRPRLAVLCEQLRKVALNSKPIVACKGPLRSSLLEPCVRVRTLDVGLHSCGREGARSGGIGLSALRSLNASAIPSKQREKYARPGHARPSFGPARPHPGLGQLLHPAENPLILTSIARAAKCTCRLTPRKWLGEKNSAAVPMARDTWRWLPPPPHHPISRKWKGNAP
jgi:hypothetical protein